MKRPHKRIIGILFAALLAGSCLAAEPEKREDYREGMFSDVSSTDWYAQDVKTCYEYGVMKGQTDGTFLPDGRLTFAEAMTLSARLHSALHSESIEEASTGQAVWYEPYALYAKENGILKEEPDSYDRPAARSEAAELFFRALSDTLSESTVINPSASLPDVPEGVPYYTSVKALYEAGILTGSDSYGNFYPAGTLTRAEAAAIMSRAAFADKRVKKTFDVIAEDDAYYLCYTYNFRSLRNEWQRDERGAAPAQTLGAPFTGLFDIKDHAGTAIIRSFNRLAVGRVVADIGVTVRGDGVYLEFQNDAGMSVYRLEIIDGKWSLLGENGTYAALCSVPSVSTAYDMRLILDLDNGYSETVINGVNYGKQPFPVSKESLNLYNFRFATTEKGTPTVKPRYCVIRANYALYEEFFNCAAGKIPYDWFASAGVGVVGEESKASLELPSGTFAATGFLPVSGKAMADFELILPTAQSSVYTLNCGETNVIRFESDEENFYVNGTKVYDDYYANLWYKVRFEIDFEARQIRFKLNGIDYAVLPLETAANSIDNLKIENTGAAAFKADTFRVCKLIDHEDYVPEPVKPVGEEKYNVGLNVCSIWTTGAHMGWSVISPFDDVEPVLGYYDEGLPETADWEIKYLVEHGVDFQAFCWYPPDSSEPLKTALHHLEDGYKNAKYSDKMKYCLLYEAESGKVAKDLQTWKDNYVPFMIENFFKDPRYMTLDNRLVMGVFAPGLFAERIGGEEVLCQAFDYLDKKVKELGFDGMLYCVGATASKSYADIGYQASFAYSWGTSGYDPEVNIRNIISSHDRGYVHTIPTVSVGFNHVPWARRRNPLITKEDYRTVHDWVKSTYLPSIEAGDWRDNTVWISTWNEYGEGTYIMPTTDNKGFQYLDVLREEYTDEKIDSSVNTIPTAKQRERINHLYPQYFHLLRRTLTEESPTETSYTINFGTDNNIGTSGVYEDGRDANGLSGTAFNNDPAVLTTSIETKVDLSKISKIVITLKTEVGSYCEFFYTTSASPDWEQKKSGSFSARSNDFESYTFRTDGFKDWTGFLKNFRIDPAGREGAHFVVRSVEFLCDTRKNLLSNQMKIDDFNIQLVLPPETAGEELLLPFDPETNMDRALNVFHEWDKNAGKLTLNFVGHKAVFTVGKNTYLFDGSEVALDSAIRTQDSIPVIPIRALLEKVGCTVSVNDAQELVIVTPDKDYYKDLYASRIPGIYDFDMPNDNEGWTSSFMALTTDDGYMHCDSTVTIIRDPTIICVPATALKASDYTKLKIRVRYAYDKADGNQTMQMFFTTDVNPGLSEANSVIIPLKNQDSDGEWEEYEADLTKIATWDGNVSYLRFDPFNSLGYMDIDYIRFVGETDETQQTVL